MFHKARLKLTAWYLLIIMIISISFSAVIYGVITNEVTRFDQIQRVRIERRLGLAPKTLPVSPLLKETKERVILNLILINLAIVALAGSGSYFLAGVTLKPIKEMIDEQDRFISDASHEFRTPLTSLKTAMEVYLRNKNPKPNEANSLIKESIIEVNKLQALSQSLLQLNQYQRTNDDTKFEKVNIKEIITGAVGKVAPIANGKKINIKTKIGNYKLSGNKYSLTDLMVILLDNAIKYSKEKSKIEVTTQKLDGHIEISVKDTGTGIDAKDIPHIFDRFYRSDKARSANNSGGYGLGLSIAKKIANLHKGSISVKSTLKKGSIFTVRLPILK